MSLSLSLTLLQLGREHGSLPECLKPNLCTNIHHKAPIQQPPGSNAAVRRFVLKRSVGVRGGEVSLDRHSDVSYCYHYRIPVAQSSDGHTLTFLSR